MALVRDGRSSSIALLVSGALLVTPFACGNGSGAASPRADAAGDDATSDRTAPGDAVADVPGTDEGILHDAGAGDAPHAADGSGACVPLSDGGYGSFCIMDAGFCAADAGTCTPVDVSGFVPKHVPPAPHRGACTTQQIQTFVTNACELPSAGAACAEFQDAGAAVACAACMVTDDTAAGYGPFVRVTGSPGDVILNDTGCGMLVEPCNSWCMQLEDARRQCQSAACQSTGCTSNVCINTADSCGCCEYATAAECATFVHGADHPAAQCFQGPDEFTIEESVAAAFCGP